MNHDQMCEGDMIYPGLSSHCRCEERQALRVLFKTVGWDGYEPMPTGSGTSMVAVDRQDLEGLVALAAAAIPFFPQLDYENRSFLRRVAADAEILGYELHPLEDKAVTPDGPAARD